MSAKAFKAHANHFLKTAKVHPEYRGGIVEEVGSDGARLIINVNVEMPFPMRARGVSPTGVRRVEDITVELWATYPWTSPQFALRPDFNRSLPHLLPDSRDEPPRPCLVDGSQREFFYNAGSLEAGIYKLLEQLVEWLRRAAKGALIDPAQGWEPIRRDTLD